MGGAIPKEFIPSIKKGLNLWSGPRISNDKNKVNFIDGAFHSVDSSD